MLVILIRSVVINFYLVTCIFSITTLRAAVVAALPRLPNTFAFMMQWMLSILIIEVFHLLVWVAWELSSVVMLGLWVSWICRFAMCLRECPRSAVEIMFERCPRLLCEDCEFPELVGLKCVWENVLDQLSKSRLRDVLAFNNLCALVK